MSALNQMKLEKTVMNRRGGADQVLGFIWQGRDVFQMERLGASNLQRSAGLYLVGWLALCLRRGPEGRATNGSYPKRSAFSLTFSLLGWFTDKSFSGGVTNQTRQKEAFTIFQKEQQGWQNNSNHIQHLHFIMSLPTCCRIYTYYF